MINNDITLPYTSANACTDMNDFSRCQIVCNNRLLGSYYNILPVQFLAWNGTEASQACFLINPFVAGQPHVPHYAAIFQVMRYFLTGYTSRVNSILDRTGGHIPILVHQIMWPVTTVCLFFLFMDFPVVNCSSCPQEPRLETIHHTTGPVGDTV